MKNERYKGRKKSKGKKEKLNHDDIGNNWILSSVNKVENNI